MGSEKGTDEIQDMLRQVCNVRFGVLDKGFLCASLGALNPRPPLCVGEATTLAEVLALLQREKVGCVLVVGSDRKLKGIFSERDFVLKVATKYCDVPDSPITDWMTADPVTQKMDGTVAFALHLMSSGGFRHLPIVDDQNEPVGMVSVKDVIDRLVGMFLEDLEKFELAL